MSDVRAPSGDTVLRRVKFDPRLPTYFLLNAIFVMLISFIGIVLIPFWVLGLGQYVHRRHYESMECELTERSLNYRRGFLFRTQKNVPLDKITDLAVSEGPILRYFGLCSLRVETAGGGANTAMGQAHLPGVVDAIEFRDAVMAQRDVVMGFAPGTSRVEAAAAVAAPTDGVDAATLSEVRDTLGRIEELLRNRMPPAQRS